jgi:hypothetical protein
VPRALDLWREGGLRLLAQRTAHKVGVVASFPYARITIGRRFFDSPYGRLAYFVHTYNETWRYERCIEVPLARAFMAAHPGRGIEIGNVLSHYGAVTHEVFDKYERARGVRNLDVLDIVDRGLAYVVCISTLEHVGWDEPERDEGKALRALAGLRSLLSPGGGVFVSFRLGHHPALTHAVLEAGLPVELQAFYARKGASWQLLPRHEALRQFNPDHHDILWFGVLPPE